MKRRHLLPFALLFIGSASMGQLNDTLELGEVIVQDSRTPVKFSESLRNITVISSAELQALPVLTVQEALAYVHSVDIRQRGPGGTQTDISLRGGTFDQCLVLIDGVKFSDPQTGHHLMNIPVQLHDIERIEILRGSASRIFGQNGFAGAINIVTKKGFGKQLYAEASVGEYESGALLLSGAYQSKTGWGNRLSVSVSGSNGYEDNRDYRNLDALYQSRYSLKNKVHFSLLGGAQQKNFGAQYFYTAPVSRFREYEETAMYFATLGAHIPKLLDLKINANWRRHDDEFRLWRDSTHRGVNTHLTNVYSLEANISKKTFWGTSSLGAEMRQEDIESSNLGNRSREIAGFFLEHQLPKFKVFTATLGTNISYISGYGWVAYPGAEIGAKLSPSLKAFGNIGRSYRVPTFTDLYYTDAGPSSLGNPNLKPESAWTWEAGLKFSRSSWHVQASYFHRQANTLIDWQKNAITDVTWRAVNIDGILTRGAEAEVIYRSKLSFLRSFRVGYTFLESSRVESAAVSRYVYDYLRQQVVAGVVMAYGKRFVHSVEYRYLERVSYPTAHVLDSRISFQMKKGSAWIGYENITGTRYYQVRNIAMPTHWIRVGIRWKLI